MLARRLTLCVPMLLYCPVVESISSDGQACVRSMRILLSEFCTVEVQNSKVSTFQGFRLYTNNVNAFQSICNIIDGRSVHRAGFHCSEGVAL